MSIIWIHVLRSLRRYGRSRMKLVAALVQPLLYFLALGFGLGPTFQDAGRGSYLQFLAPAIVAMATLFSAIGSGVELMVDGKFGILRQVLVAPVSRLTIIAARTVAGATVATIQGALVLVACIIAGFRPTSLSGLAVALVIMMLIALFFSALGTATAARMSDLGSFQFVINFVVMPLYFFSAALYPVTNMPPTMRVLVSLNPLTYGIDGLRTVLTGGTTPFGVVLDVSVLAVSAGILIVVGAMQFSRLEL